MSIGQGCPHFSNFVTKLKFFRGMDKVYENNHLIIFLYKKQQIFKYHNLDIMILIHSLTYAYSCLSDCGAINNFLAFSGKI